MADDVYTRGGAGNDPRKSLEERDFDVFFRLSPLLPYREQPVVSVR